MKRPTEIAFFLILLFHILYTANAAYTMFQDYQVWTMYKWHPILLAILTLAWFGAWRGKYQFGLLYIGLVMLEFLSKAFFKGHAWSEVTGSVMFPMDLIFTAVLLALFKLHFGDIRRSDQTEDISS